MKEVEFPGRLPPSVPNLFPIVKQMRKKYNVLEISPNEYLISEYYLRSSLYSIEIAQVSNNAVIKKASFRLFLFMMSRRSPI